MISAQRLVVVLFLNLGLVVGLVVVGAAAHSLGVLAAGGDYLLDAAGVGAALAARALARRPATARRPDGYPNALTIAAIVNSGWLLVLELLVAVAAIVRLGSGVPEVHGLAVLIASGTAALVMTVAALVLGRGVDDIAGDEPDLSAAAVILDTVADAAAAAGVAVVGAVILTTGGWYWLDPAVALAIALVIGYHAVALLRRAVRRLRGAQPRL